MKKDNIIIGEVKGKEAKEMMKLTLKSKPTIISILCIEPDKLANRLRV